MHTARRSQTTLQKAENPLIDTAGNGNFKFTVLNEPEILSASFALRYKVYCTERNFLLPDCYPLQLETDHYDGHAVHVGGINGDGNMVGTVRLVLHSAAGFPLFEHCQIFPEFEYLADAQLRSRIAEVSRLAITRHHRNLCGGVPYKTDQPFNNMQSTSANDAADAPVADLPQFYRANVDIILGIYRIIYQASKRRGITHWCAAMEKSLVRLMRRFHFSFTAIGPELDYFGPVTPYIVALTDIEHALYHHCPATFTYFMKGLEPELVPAVAGISSSRQ